jgi:hypothetical protein
LILTAENSTTRSLASTRPASATPTATTSSGIGAAFEEVPGMVAPSNAVDLNELRAPASLRFPNEEVVGR